MSNLTDNLSNFISEINQINRNIDIVLATKYANLDQIGAISKTNETVIFGENRVQAGEEKQRAYPSISNPWHFIGHLQRNKVKKVIGNYDLIHSVDSIRLIDEINKQSQAKKPNKQCIIAN